MVNGDDGCSLQTGDLPTHLLLRFYVTYIVYYQVVSMFLCGFLVRLPTLKRENMGHILIPLIPLPFLSLPFPSPLSLPSPYKRGVEKEGMEQSTHNDHGMHYCTVRTI